MRPTLLLLVLSAGLSASPCVGQGAPPNPFASNYPSAPPSLEQAERARVRQARPRTPRHGERGPIPPAPIPNR
ncbi:hypothetical protein [Methylorubrum salsuginis]|uniref:Uncharacterized protein n=1 Tax=Methylorubrum salsuginis TaxID=414703 RepID=A0A1I4KF04_9HYPH|nr:hypothetical protein [Methylorubrum salsuginis]SFL77037.1 hypothetical protein SAMN04488125_12414 [Methylorubrum salsuginis]